MGWGEKKKGGRNVPHEQRGRRATSETQGRKREKESEIVQKSGRKSYSGNDVVAMATLSSDTPQVPRGYI